jgi:hypothetical protein
MLAILEGFELCLRNTLYRPRDILVLLNEAYATAQRSGRESIIGEDIEKSATQISQNRLNDLLTEYDTVLPGLKQFVAVFVGAPAQAQFGTVTKMLDEIVQRTESEGTATRDFALFNSGSEIFSALYSVGFIGVQDLGTGRVTFCHDGSSSALASIAPDRLTTLHPCYWKALEVSGETPPDSVIICGIGLLEAGP